MKKQILVLLIFVITILLTLSSCGTVSSRKDFSSEALSVASGQYIIQTPHYQIIEKDTQSYYYKIASGDKIYVDDIKKGTSPEIVDVGDGIIRLFLGYGTNNCTLQYFDVYNDRVSEVISPYTDYADYIDPKTKECFVAYFDSPAENPVLTIKSVFDQSDLSVDIDRNFSAALCNRMVFLNDSEIYLDYDAFDQGYSYDDVAAGRPVKYKNIRETVKFR